jgi:hypothetical protein
VDFSHRGVIYSVAKRYSSEVNDINLFLVTGVEFSYKERSGEDLGKDLGRIWRYSTRVFRAPSCMNKSNLRSYKDLIHKSLRR